MYNACYVTYLEVAQVEYFRSLGILIYDEKARASFDTATVKVTLEFKAPTRLDEMIDVYTRVSRIGSSSFTMETEIYREDSDLLLVNAQLYTWTSARERITGGTVSLFRIVLYDDFDGRVASDD